jgi:hypothetical protein
MPRKATGQDVEIKVVIDPRAKHAAHAPGNRVSDQQDMMERLFALISGEMQFLARQNGGRR